MRDANSTPWSAFVMRGLCVLCVLALTSRVEADQPEVNVAHDAQSASGRFVMNMRPAADFGLKGNGVAFEIDERGETKLWAVDWFANKVEIADDGEYLVRYGPWGTDQNNHSDLGIAFYRRGQLVREYRVNELVKDPKAIVHSASHYLWQPEKQSIPTGFHGDGRYRLVVADKTVYEFELATGEVAASYVDQEARNWYEVRAEEQEVARQRGLRAFEASGLDRLYAQHFVLHEVQADRGKTMGVHFDGAEWSADLKPTRKFARTCLVEAHFPLRDDDRIDVKLRPEEILAALDRALAHPFIEQRFEHGGATRIRLRITGDRLHWDTPELREFLQKLGHRDLRDDVLRHWAYVIIDAAAPRCTSVYLNVESGELIYEDHAKWPWEPVLVNAAGN